MVSNFTNMTQRYYSLDVFRGATVALMILVNNPGSWDDIFPPLDHSLWHGCTPTDLVFPFFLFAVGNALAFVMPKFEKEGTAYFLQKVVKRTLLIFAIGLFLNWSPFVKWDHGHLIPKIFANVRIMGVLQRIALCYCVAALCIYYFKINGVYLISAILLLSYWFICAKYGATTDPFSLSGYFGTNFDNHILGVTHLYKGEGIPFDPEGLASTPAAIIEVMIGYTIGRFVQLKGKNFEMVATLFVIAIALIMGGYWWDMLFPINKKIWTSSYTLYTTGLATLTLAVLIYWIEMKEKVGTWSKFFNVFGKNPLFIFVLSGFLPRVLGLIKIADGFEEDGTKILVSPFGWFYNHVCKNIATDLRFGSLLYALIMIAFYWLIVFILDKKKIYIKV